MTRFYYSCAHEQFPPGELLRQAAAAEAAGFDGVGCSATTVVLSNIPGAHPLAAIDVYARRVLPAVRGRAT